MRTMEFLCKSLLAGLLGLAVVAGVGVPAQDVKAVTIDLGGVKLRVPGVTSQPRRRGRSHDGSSIYSHARWHVAVHQARRFATNGQGIWIGYDERGNMVMHIELATPTPQKPKTEIAVQIHVDKRLYEVVKATVANERLVVVQGAEVERILGKLKTGRRLAIIFDGYTLETHLRGSSGAIKTVRNEAAVQRSLFARGQVTTKQTERADSPDQISYYLPGVSNRGKAEVRFDIIEGTGLVLLVHFHRIPGHGDPHYKIRLTRTEAERAAELLEKADMWTEIARRERVGLFSKRIGFVDDALAAPKKQEPQATQTQAGGGATRGSGIGAGVGVATAQAERSTAQSGGGMSSPNPAGSQDPTDFTAVNFNSYEDGTTSAQIEHTVQRFSRRFNLSLKNALMLANSLKSTIEYASFRLEKRDFDMEEKSKLFQ